MTAINNENDLFMFNNYVPHIDYFIPYMWEKNNTIPPMAGNGKHTTFFSGGDIGDGLLRYH